MTQHRVLVVDDDAAFGKLLRRVVTGAGHEVETVTVPSDILERYDAFNPDIIFLDLFMPDMDGFEVASWLSAHGFDGKLIFVSGHDPRFSAMARRLAEARGKAEVITLGKPIRVNQIRDILDGGTGLLSDLEQDQPKISRFRPK